MLRNGLHNPDVPPLLGADDVENTASIIVPCWTVLAELLPGNALIKFITI
jgi:galactitol-specific phosphotransferase system IIC component